MRSHDSKIDYGSARAHLLVLDEPLDGHLRTDGRVLEAERNRASSEPPQPVSRIHVGLRSIPGR